MIQHAHLHHSVYISNGLDRAALKWCGDTFGISREPWVGCTWSFRYDYFHTHGVCTHYCVVAFATAAHKFMFDIAWAHLEIHDSSAALAAAQSVALAAAQQRIVT